MVTEFQQVARCEYKPECNCNDEMQQEKVNEKMVIVGIGFNYIVEDECKENDSYSDQRYEECLPCLLYTSRCV